MEKKVLVLGAGFAGVSIAQNLINSGYGVDVIEPSMDRPGYRSVYSTSVGCSSLDEMKQRHPDHFLQLGRMAAFNGRGESITVAMPEGEGYFMMDTAGLLERERKQLGIDIQQLPKEVMRDVQFFGTPGCVSTTLPGFESRNYNAVVACTGFETLLHQNWHPIQEWVYGGLYRGRLVDDEAVSLVIGPAGGTSWICRSALDKDYFDIGFSAYGPKQYFSKFKQEAPARLEHLIRFAVRHGIIAQVDSIPTLEFSGAITMELNRRRSVCFTAGQEAGLSKPGTGDLMRRTLNDALIVSDMIISGKNPQDMIRYRKRKFVREDATLMAMLMQRMENQEKIDGIGQIVSFLNQILDSNNSERFVQTVQRYIVNGELSIGLALKMFGQGWFIKAFPKIAFNLARIAIDGHTECLEPRGYYLPKIH